MRERRFEIPTTRHELLSIAADKSDHPSRLAKAVCDATTRSVIEQLASSKRSVIRREKLVETADQLRADSRRSVSLLGAAVGLEDLKKDKKLVEKLQPCDMSECPCQEEGTDANAWLYAERSKATMYVSLVQKFPGVAAPLRR